MDPFLDSITDRVTADPLFGSQSASRKNRHRTKKDKLREYSVIESHNRQVVHLQSQISRGCIKLGSGVLIHHIRNSLSDVDCFDWVLTAAHCVTTFDDGIKKALEVQVDILGTHKGSHISARLLRDPIQPRSLIEAFAENKEVMEPNMHFQIESDQIFIYDGYYKNPSSCAGFDLALLHLNKSVIFHKGLSGVSTLPLRIVNHQKESFSVCGFKNYTQFRCEDDKYIIDKGRQYFEEKYEVEPTQLELNSLQFIGFSKDLTRCFFSNQTCHGISGGMLCFEKDKIGGIHSCGNALTNIQGGVIFNEASWNWIKRVQERETISIADFWISFLRGDCENLDKLLADIGHAQKQEIVNLMRVCPSIVFSIFQKGNIKLFSLMNRFLDGLHVTYDHRGLFRHISNIYPHDLGHTTAHYLTELGFDLFGKIEFIHLCIEQENENLALEMVKDLYDKKALDIDPFIIHSYFANACGFNLPRLAQFFIDTGIDINTPDGKYFFILLCEENSGPKRH